MAPNPEVNAWVHIHHDDTVTVRIARSEMGQGTATGLAQLVALRMHSVQRYYHARSDQAKNKLWQSR